MPTTASSAACSTSPGAEQFTVGQTVAVKRRGHAVVIEDVVTEPGHQFHGRYRVRYRDGGTYYCRPDAMRPVLTPPSRVLVCKTTRAYRHAAATYADPDDVVLEVGCHEGITTALLSTRCKWMLGIDKAPDCIHRATKRFPHCSFRVADGFDTAALKALLPQGCTCYSKIFIDISGIADLQLVMGIVAAHFSAFKDAYIVVKSVHMHRFMGMAAVYEPFAAADGAGDADDAGDAACADESAEAQQGTQHVDSSTGGGVPGAATPSQPGNVGTG